MKTEKHIRGMLKEFKEVDKENEDGGAGYWENQGRMQALKWVLKK